MIPWLLGILITTGCSAYMTPSSSQRAAPRQHIDLNAQQYYYDLGLRQYSKENYQEAEASFQRVVENGPSTTLGQRAQENLKKIQQILKTLEDIRTK